MQRLTPIAYWLFENISYRRGFMPSHKIQRINEDIRRELSAIFRELKDPRINSGLVSIVRVEVTNDLSYCKVYVSSLNGLKEAEVAVEGLKSASGYIKRELGRKLEIRHIPALIFCPTDSIEYGASISKMLNNLKGEN